MPRITVFVPDEIYEGMQAVRTRTGPNWSRVATEAFRRVLEELREARSAMATTVRLPYPTAGDYEVFEVRLGRRRFQVKASGTVCAPRYVHRPRLDRIVAEFARQVVEDNPNLQDGDLLPRTLTSGIADAISKRL